MLSDLSGFDPADPTKDAKMFLIEACIELVSRIENKCKKSIEAVRAGEVHLGVDFLLSVNQSLDVLGENGYLGRLKQHLDGTVSKEKGEDA